ncbi:hypothetical protein O0I10_011656 [Lichtheimia ornata]|uniref:Uncharacterized protein n=1 Tax=Lichtheimia ornata TaxID=688661 RepID=A0AAD7UTA8_9FUNG|nr:uncharacterized protein O0I10_011656 [Lichtheimia ornata]KAJ8652711.1 hypothetical protein O0I10_011656 [Lichtheimia ornata]
MSQQQGPKAAQPDGASPAAPDPNAPAAPAAPADPEKHEAASSAIRTIDECKPKCQSQIGDNLFDCMIKCRYG